MALRKKQGLPAAWRCPACGGGLEGPVRADLSPVAWHEAGHAVMRWHQGHPPGALCIHPDGGGYSAPGLPGRVIDRDALLRITMAGMAGEMGGLPGLDLAASTSADLEDARALLTPEYLAHLRRRGGPRQRTPPEILQDFYEQARTLILQHFERVEAVAEALLEARTLSAHELQALLGTPPDDDADE